MNYIFYDIIIDAYYYIAKGEGGKEMGGKKLDIRIIVAVVAVSFLIVTMGQFLYQKFYINTPLTEELRQVQGVNDVKIEEINGKKNIAISLGRIDNLQNSYLMMGEIVKKKEGNTGKLVILDNPSSYMEDVYREMNFSIQDAIVNGSFADMYDDLEKVAKEKNLRDWTIYIDQDNIYLQIQDQDNYLYRVIPRIAGSERNVEGI